MKNNTSRWVLFLAECEALEFVGNPRNMVVNEETILTQGYEFPLSAYHFWRQ
jgi:hypothetical protein